jgi:hypothetical protein
MQVRPINEAQEKFKARAAGAREDYKRGEQGAGQRWLDGAANSGEAWRAGTQEAITQGRFERGVRAAGATKYQERAAAVGPERFASGVAIGAPEWGRNFAPFQQALAAHTPAARGPRGSDQNAQRSIEVARLMRRVRNERLGG